MARVEAGQGATDACRAHVEKASAISERFGGRHLYVFCACALGLLELGLGNAAGARAHLAALTEWMVTGGWYGILHKERFVADFIEATVIVGDVSEARRLLRWFEELTARTGGWWSRAAVLRCRALLHDGDADALFAEALVAHGHTAGAFEEARTELAYGEWLRRSRRPRDAREQLQHAYATFERLGAAPWFERAGRELQAAGAHAPAGDAPAWSGVLTAQEIQVARVVADGASHKEAAAALFLSAKTIEFHLGNVYRKLGIRSRSELARVVSDAVARR
jgi:DNA-binding CsgD family transcriptional regulator